MKDFTDWGLKRRVYPEKNYNAIWNNLKTYRFGEGQADELEPELSEFYDVGINTLCNIECPFCYVSASGKGENYLNISETWKKWMSQYKEVKENGITLTDKPFQIAIGSTGEPTLHPEFCDFLETVYNTGVVPNYTTNGIVLSRDDERSERILRYTDKYVGGVAVSFSNKNPNVRGSAERAVNKLLEHDVHVNIHHIIDTKESVDEFIRVWKHYGNRIKYHVLLPLMPSGRSDRGVEEGVWEYLEERVRTLKMENVAFGAHFIKNLETAKLKTWLYPAESFSKNVILTENKVQITPSSFNLKPIKIIEL